MFAHHDPVLGCLLTRGFLMQLASHAFSFFTPASADFLSPSSYSRGTMTFAVEFRCGLDLILDQFEVRLGREHGGWEGWAGCLVALAQTCGRAAVAATRP